jgi:hypothetical protein
MRLFGSTPYTTGDPLSIRLIRPIRARPRPFRVTRKSTDDFTEPCVICQPLNYHLDPQHAPWTFCHRGNCCVLGNADCLTPIPIVTVPERALLSQFRPIVKPCGEIFHPDSGQLVHPISKSVPRHLHNSLTHISHWLISRKIWLRSHVE